MYSEEGGKKAQCILAKDGSCLISFFFLSVKDESLDGMNRPTQLVCIFVFSLL